MLGFLGVPCPAFRSLSSPTVSGSSKGFCRQGDEVCEGGRRAGLGGTCGAAVALQVTNPSRGHGGHSQSLKGLENIFHPLIIGCSQSSTGM